MKVQTKTKGDTNAAPQGDQPRMKIKTQIKAGLGTSQGSKGNHNQTRVTPSAKRR
jgi:hypothetical protein